MGVSWLSKAVSWHHAISDELSIFAKIYFPSPYPCVGYDIKFLVIMIGSHDTNNSLNVTCHYNLFPVNDCRPWPHSRSFLLSLSITSTTYSQYVPTFQLRSPLLHFFGTKANRDGVLALFQTSRQLADYYIPTSDMYFLSFFNDCPSRPHID